MNNVPNLRFRDFNDAWEEDELGNIIEISKNKYNPLKCEETYKCIELENISQGTGQLLGCFNSKDQQSVKNKFDTGQVLFGKLRPYLRKYWLAEFEGVCSSEIWVLEGKKILNQFLYYVIQTDKFNFISNISSGSKMPRADWSYMSEYPFYVPSLEEQEKIASFFSLIDKKIELQTEKVEELKNYKKGIMQKIFSQELRFKDENGNEYPSWTKCKIYDCFVERSEKGFEDLELLSVSMERGVIKRSEIESKDNSSENKSNYKLVKKGDIVYNSMRMWQGASGLSEYEGIVSPAYTVLTPKKDIYSNYFSYLFKMHTMIHEFRKYSQGLTSDTWNLKYPQIKDIKVNVPSYEEQVKISQFFYKLDIRIEKEQDNLKCLIEYKKGLLQQMFI